MEYLVTYGWALLALFAVLALLFSTGAISTGNFSVAECTFQPDLPCSSFIIYKSAATGTTTLEFTLTNGLGFAIQPTGIEYTATNFVEQGRQTYQGVVPAGIVPSGGQMHFVHDFSGIPSGRDFRTIYASITYSNCKSGTCTNSYTTSGRISSPVETQ